MLLHGGGFTVEGMIDGDPQACAKEKQALQDPESQEVILPDADVQDVYTLRRRSLLRKTFLALALAILLYVYHRRIISSISNRRWNLDWFGHHHCSKEFWLNIEDVVTNPEDLANDTRLLGQTPQYVLDYAPYVHLYSEEQFWPCDIADHLLHVTPELDYTPIQARSLNMNLTNLNTLNEYDHGRHVYLTSDDNVEERPDWLGGQKNIPDEFTEEGKPHVTNVGRLSHGGRSDAPAVLITINKGHGIVDAFWFFFYSYNLGNIVLNIRFGNHVGDWEHTLIRFKHGKPKLVFYSEHNFGDAYTYEAVEKIGKRVSSVSLHFVRFVADSQ